MAAPAGSLSPTERLAVCASLAPDIVQVTADYYDPEAPHPYLKSSSGGGILVRELVTPNSETFTIVSVHGIPAGGRMAQDLLERGGLPGEISEEQIIWSVATDHELYPATAENAYQPQPIGMTAHSWSYWDGKRWHTVRNGEPKQGVGTPMEWVSSTLVPEELLAMKAVAKQIRGLHQLAEVYDGDVNMLEDDMGQLDVDDEMKQLLSVAFAGSLSVSRELESIGLEQRGFMPYNRTGYQDITQLMRRIPLGKSFYDIEAGQIGPVGATLAKMYRGSAFIQKDSMRKRAYRARMRGRPLPLPASW